MGKLAIWECENGGRIGECSPVSSASGGMVCVVGKTEASEREENVTAWKHSGLPHESLQCQSIERSVGHCILITNDGWGSIRNQIFTCVSEVSYWFMCMSKSSNARNRRFPG